MARTTAIERIKPGPRMSGAVVHGNTVYLAGQVAQNAGGKSVTEQTRDILAIIDGLLAEAGTDKSRLLMANIWLADIGDLPGDERGLGRLGRAGQRAGPRHRRGEARGAAVQGGDRRHRRKVADVRRTKRLGPAGPNIVASRGRENRQTRSPLALTG